MEDKKTNVHNVSDEIDVRHLLQKAWFYKYWILAFVVLALLGAYVYLRYSTPQYASSAKILLRDESTGGGMVSEEQIFQDLGIFTGNKNVLNEIAVLQSQTLMEEVVKELDLHYQIFKEGKIKNTETYTEQPLRVDTANITGVYELEITDSAEYLLSHEEWGEVQSFSLDSFYVLERGFIKLSSNAITSSFAGEPLNVVFSTVSHTARLLTSKLTVTRESEWASIINIYSESNHPVKAADIINTLIEKYKARVLREKNEGYERTLDFIEDRLELLAEELGFVEENIETFKERNLIAGDATEAVAEMSEELSEFERRKSQLELKEDILRSLQEQLRDLDRSYQLLPMSLTAANESINSLVARYNELIFERKQLLSSAGAENPALNTLEGQIQDLKQNILRNIESAIRENDYAIGGVNEQIREVMGNFRSVPRKERELLEIVRQQRIKENLYLYLLEKREEIALSMTMASSNIRVIDEARVSSFPISPDRVQVYSIFLAIGLLLPLLLILVHDVLDNKIRSREDIKKLVNFPVIGEIPEQEREKSHILAADGSDQTSEMFRLLRTNVNFLISGATNPNILVTSFESGEGKTFVASNLALSFATANKKTLLLGLDLRKPRLHDYFSFSQNAPGVTNYILGEAEFEDIVHPSEVNENLYVIPSGIIPPNPAELLLKEKFEDLIKLLEKNFDVIIWDTAPVGLVSDTISISRFATCTMFIVKQGVSYKNSLEIFTEENEDKNLPQPAIVLNGVKEGTFYGYGRYKYGYRRYNKGYYQ